MNTFEHVTTIPHLIDAAHTMAASKGWWIGGSRERPVADQVNNFHAEISEAWEEYRAGRMELWWSKRGRYDDKPPWESYIRECREIGNRRHDSFLADGWKPEGFYVELADLVIRLCDTAGAYGWTLTPVVVTGYASISVAVSELHSTIEMMLFADDTKDEETLDVCWSSYASRVAEVAVETSFDTAKRHGVDLWPLILLKLSYNATRPARHGGKLA